MRYSRNKNDLPKAFSAKVMARIQAERQRGGGQVGGCSGHVLHVCLQVAADSLLQSITGASC